MREIAKADQKVGSHALVFTSVVNSGIYDCPRFEFELPRSVPDGLRLRKYVLFEVILTRWTVGNPEFPVSGHYNPRVEGETVIRMPTN